MAEEKDYTKLRKFVEAAITNPLHPVYRLGLSHSGMLQHYAVNVMTLDVIESQKWFEDYPQYTAKLQEVMALCEQIDKTHEADAMMTKCPKCGAEFDASKNTVKGG